MRSSLLVLTLLWAQPSMALQMGAHKRAIINRRSLLLSLPAVSILPIAAVALEPSSGLEAVETPVVRKTSVSYEDLSQLLIECKETDTCNVERVVFSVASGELGDVLMTSGERLPITGIPEENPSNDSSPYKLIAKLRDSRVPYSFPFSDTLAKYRKS